jgi:WD40 repeat protein
VAVPRDDGTLTLIPRVGAVTAIAPPDGSDNRRADGIVATSDGKSLITSHVDGSIRRWTPSSGTVEMVISAEEVGDDHSALSLDIDPSGRWLAATRSDDLVKLYDLSRRSPTIVLQVFGRDTKTVAFSPNGKRLAVLGSDGQLYEWDFDPASGSIGDGLSTAAVPQSLRIDPGRDRGRPASWIDWLDDDRLAIATIYGSVLYLNFDRAVWRKRLEEVASIDDPSAALSRKPPADTTTLP